MFIWRKVGPTRNATLPSQNIDPGHSTSRANLLFLMHVNGSSCLVRKCIKRWLAQGSFGRRATLPLGTTFPHIKVS